jgi:hypothetical protein
MQISQHDNIAARTPLQGSDRAFRFVAREQQSDYQLLRHIVACQIGDDLAPGFLRFAGFCGGAAHAVASRSRLADGPVGDVPVPAALRIFRAGPSRFACFT